MVNWGAMSTSRIEGESFFHFDQEYFHQQVQQLTLPATRKFLQISKSHIFIHLSFFILFLIEGLGALFLLDSFVTSSLFAVFLAALFLTGFSYFIVRLYLQAKKPEQLLRLREQYLQTCRDLIQYQEGVAEHHMALANAAHRLATAFYHLEYRFYTLPRGLEIFLPSWEKVSCWLHWKDVDFFQESLLSYSVEEQIKLVKVEPVSLDVHAALANAYVVLSNLYYDPRHVEGGEGERWVPAGKTTKERYHKFRDIAKKAVEELKIISDFAPDDPWVHLQLAYSYHDLHMPAEEIAEYEKVHQLCPDDQDAVFKLGVLYFQQGHNGKGLRIYEELKRSHYRKAEDLIKFYGTYQSIEE